MSLWKAVIKANNILDFGELIGKDSRLSNCLRRAGITTIGELNEDKINWMRDNVREFGDKSRDKALLAIGVRKGVWSYRGYVLLNDGGNILPRTFSETEDECWGFVLRTGTDPEWLRAHYRVVPAVLHEVRTSKAK